MNKLDVRGVIFLLSLLSVAVMAVSCVNEKYDMSGDKVNLEVNPFSEGLAIPIGKTGQVKLKDLLKDVDPELLKPDENGVYSISFNDEFDMSEELLALKDMINVPDVDIDREVNFKLGDIDVSDISMDARRFPYEYPLTPSFEIPDLTLPPIYDNFDVDAGLREYAPSDEDLAISLQPISRIQKVLSLKPEIQAAIPSGSLSDDEITLEGSPYERFLSQNKTFGPHGIEYGMTLSFPKEIASVDEIILHENAGIKVTVSIDRAFILSGEIIPDFEMDFSGLFHLKGGEDIVNIKDVLTLSDGNDYSASYTYPISALAVDASDWKKDDYGITLEKKFMASIEGSVGTKDLATTTRLLADPDNSEINLRFNIEFVNLEVVDIAMTMSPMVQEHKKDVELTIGNIELPKEVRGVRDVVFTEGSGLDIEIKALNLDKMPGISAEMEIFEITFPEGMHIEGASDGNKIIVNGADLEEGVERHVNITGMDFPAPVDGILVFNELVNVNARMKATGSFHSKDLPARAEDDIRITVRVDSDIEVKDYNIMFAGYERELDIASEKIKIEIPQKLAGMEEIVVYPEGEAYIGIDMSIPDFGFNVGPAEGGINLSFPEMLKFDILPSSYNYDLGTNSITLTETLSEYGNIRLPIEKLVLTPVLDPSDNKYYACGEVQINGGIAVGEGLLSKEQIDELASPDPSRKIEIVMEISEFRPATLDAGTFETAIKENVEFSLLAAGSLPEELVSVSEVELKDTYINLSLDASELPDLGESTLSVDIKVDFPDFISIPSADESGFLRLSGELENGIIAFEPVKVAALDLSDADLTEGLKGVVAIDGVVKLENASLDIDQLAGRQLKAEIKAEMKDIDIAKITGRVDYDIEPVEQTVDLGDFSEALGGSGAEVNLDFARANLAVEILSNLNIPVEANVELLPYYNGSPDASKAITTKLVLNRSEDTEEEAATRYWISNTDDKCPTGYTFVEADVLGLLKNIPEKLELKLTAGTDPDSDCVLEPSAEYSLKANYRFELPLEFGEEFEVIYKTTVKDIPEIVGELLMTGNKVMLGGEIMNGLPLGLELSLNLLDSDGNTVPLDKDCGVQKIAPCGLDGKPVGSKLEIVLGLRKGSEIKDIKDLELVLNANSAGMTGVSVTEDAYLEAVLQAVLPEGVTVDLNDFLNNGEEDNE